MGQGVPAMHHHMARGKDSPPGTHNNSHNCVCPWECGSSRGQADPVRPLWDLKVAETPRTSALQVYLEPAGEAHAFLQLTTGPPAVSAAG